MTGSGLATMRYRIPKVAFGHYLRTEFVSLPDVGGVEVKFNPWHDPQTGQFTSGNGSWGGGGFTGRGGGSVGGGGASGRWNGSTAGKAQTTKR